jgi:carboxyl-terminal processing protease
VIVSLFRSVSATFLVVFVLLLPFVSGYVVGQSDAASPPKILLDSWLSRAGLGSPRERDVAPAPPQEAEAAFKPLWEAVGIVNQEFFDEQVITQEKLSRGAIRGMLSTLDDPYTLYMDPVHREVSDADLRGAFDGIGVQIEIVDQRLKVIAPLEGSPGEKAGVRTGDVISHVDGRDLRGVALTEAIQLIRGPRGTTVTLTVEREGRTPFDVPIQRDEIRTPAVRAEVRDGIGYVRISTFSQRVGAEVRQAVERIGDQAPRGWVLDLRGNPGGYLDGAVSVASQFMNDGVVLYEQGRNGERSETRSRGTPRATTGSMIVLVDRGSASASEIVAAALRDNGRATLMGETTFGKGSVQKVHRLSDGGAIRLTIAAWLTPRGDRIHGIGLVPDVPVVAVAGSDVVLEQALNAIRSQPASAGTVGSPAAMATGEPNGSTPTRLRVSEALPADAGSAPPGEESSVVLLDSDERLALAPRGIV